MSLDTNRQNGASARIIGTLLAVRAAFSGYSYHNATIVPTLSDRAEGGFLASWRKVKRRFILLGALLLFKIIFLCSRMHSDYPIVMNLSDLAATLGCELRGDGSIEITGVAGMEQAGDTEITSLHNPKYAPKAKQTRAGAILVKTYLDDIAPAQLLSKNPYLDFARALELFYQPPRPAVGIHPLAYVAPTAQIGENASIGPFVSVGENVTIGRDAVLYPHAVI